MQRPLRSRAWLAVALVAVAALALPSAALAQQREKPPVDSFTYTQNLHPQGFSPQGNSISPFTANSDLAFWGKLAFQVTVQSRAQGSGSPRLWAVISSRR